MLSLCSHGGRLVAGERGIQHGSVKVLGSCVAPCLGLPAWESSAVLCYALSLGLGSAHQRELINPVCAILCAWHTGQEVSGLFGISQKWRTVQFLSRFCINWGLLEMDFFYMQSRPMVFVIWFDRRVTYPLSWDQTQVKKNELQKSNFKQKAGH